MRDSVLRITIVGILGTIVLDLMIYLITLFGVKTSTPWSVAADVFLTSNKINTLPGVIIGLLGTLGLGIAVGIILFIVFRLTGYDYAVLKGILVNNAFAFVNMGLFMPLLKIAPQVQNQPVTNIVALLSLTLVGTIMGIAFRKLSTVDQNKTTQHHAGIKSYVFTPAPARKPEGKRKKIRLVKPKKM